MYTNLQGNLPLGNFAGLKMGMVLIVCSPALIPNLAISQERIGRQATLVVDGRVQKIFRSAEGPEEQLVQILVQQVSAHSKNGRAVVADFPAPQESVYVHVGGADRRARGSLPPLQATIRAYLEVGAAGEWEGRGSDWFEQQLAGDMADDVAARRSRDTANQEEGGGLGIFGERSRLGFGAALKVVRVAPGSPAAAAGFEAGDVIVKANGQKVTTNEQLERAFRESRGTLTLTVRDVRSGRDVDVEVETAKAARTRRSAPSLGVKAEMAFLDDGKVVKIKEVASNSPAKRAGLRAGWLILKVDGRRIESPEDLATAERASVGPLTLTIVDPADRQERRITVER